jgi:hypothetical protein
VSSYNRGDGAGLSDATSPNGNISNAVFENIDYGFLTIGNYELYPTNIAPETFTQFSKQCGEKVCDLECADLE